MDGIHHTQYGVELSVHTLTPTQTQYEWERKRAHEIQRFDRSERKYTSRKFDSRHCRCLSKTTYLERTTPKEKELLAYCCCVFSEPKFVVSRKFHTKENKSRFSDGCLIDEM